MCVNCEEAQCAFRATTLQATNTEVFEHFITKCCHDNACTIHDEGILFLQSTQLHVLGTPVWHLNARDGGGLARLNFAKIRVRRTRILENTADGNELELSFCINPGSNTIILSV